MLHDLYTKIPLDGALENGKEWVVDVTKLVGPFIPVHSVVGFVDRSRLFDVAGPLTRFNLQYSGILNDVVVLD